MSKIAFLFPGQGSQQVGMGRRFAENYPEAAAAFRDADEELGFSLSGLCFEGPEEELALTANTQPAVLTASVAAFRALTARGWRADVVAGHSLGEYSALVAAGSLTLRDGVRLVRRRGEEMQRAVPVGEGGMAAIVGLTTESVAAACAEAAEGKVCVPANFNSPSQIVISGHLDAVRRAAALCKERGAKMAVMLNVSAPFHSPLMEPAQQIMAGQLETTPFSQLTTPLINNVDAAQVTSGGAARAGLVRQMSAAVKWTESIQRMLADGVTTLVEVGPGKVLIGLARAIAKDAGIRVELLHADDVGSPPTLS